MSLRLADCNVAGRIAADHGPSVATNLWSGGSGANVCKASRFALADSHDMSFEC